MAMVANNWIQHPDSFHRQHHDQGDYRPPNSIFSMMKPEMSAVLHHTGVIVVALVVPLFVKEMNLEGV